MRPEMVSLAFNSTRANLVKNWDCGDVENAVTTAIHRGGDTKATRYSANGSESGDALFDSAQKHQAEVNQLYDGNEKLRRTFNEDHRTVATIEEQRDDQYNSCAQ